MNTASSESVSQGAHSPEAEATAAPAAEPEASEVTASAPEAPAPQAVEAEPAPAPAPEIKAPEPAPYYAPEAANDPRPKARGGGAAWAVALLLIVVGGVGSSPWWSPSVIPLLPWAAESGAGAGIVADAALRQELSALALRVASVEQNNQTGQMDATSGSMGTSPAGAGPVAGGAEISALQDTVRQQGAAVKDLADRVNSFEQRLAAIASGGGSAAGAASAPVSAALPAGLEDDLKRLSDRESAVESKLAALEFAGNAAPSGTAQSAGQGAAPALPPGLVEDTRRLGSDLSVLKDRVSRLETTPVATAALGRTDVGLLLSLGQLRGAVDAGRAFAGPLATVRDPGIASTLAPLSRYADSGVPTLSTLRQNFGQISGSIVQAAATIPASEELGDVVVSKIRSLVTIRRTGAGGTGPAAGADGAVANAEAALKANDLSGAVAALANLPAPAAKIAAPWIEQAKARLQADAVLASAENALTARFAGEAAH